MIAPQSDHFLSEEDLDLQNLTEEELVAWWNLWLEQAQVTNKLDQDEYAHGVFRHGPRDDKIGRRAPDAAPDCSAEKPGYPQMARHDKESISLPGLSATLAQRLGVTVHVSPLRFRLARMMLEFPSSGAQCLEDWLLDVVNARGARFVTRWPPASPDFIPPPSAMLSNEELVVAICQPHNLDRPQMLRAAAQLVSMQAVNAEILRAMARRERAELVLAELARQAMHVAPEHPVWRALNGALAHVFAPREPILHWTRLAVPIPNERGCNAKGWRLVA